MQSLRPVIPNLFLISRRIAMSNSRNLLVFVVILTFIFTIRLYHLNSKDTLQCPTPNDTPKLIGNGNSHGGFQSYLEASEKVRERFLEKRRTGLFGKRNEDNTRLWLAYNHYVWHYFPPTFTCPHILERVGRPWDGGKWVCGLNVFEDREEPCVIYSFGVGRDSSFESEMVERANCRVNVYDYTVEKLYLPANFPKELEQRMSFHKLGIGNGKGKDAKFRTLFELMEENGDEWIDFLKIDIEQAEFAVLTEIAESFPTLPFGHLNLEVHLTIKYNDTKTEMSDFKRLFDLWNLLEGKGLRAVSWEDNMAPCAGRIGMPGLMEYTFINVIDERNKLLNF